MTTSTTEDFILSVTAKDRPGIIAAVTRTLFELGGNVTELSQTVMRGYFTLILCVALPKGLEPEVIRSRVEGSEPAFELSVGVRRYDPKSLFVPEPEAGVYFLTLQGKDRPGLIARITAHLASRSINIEDLYTRTEGEEITMILQLRPQSPPSAEQLRLDLAAIASELDVAAYLLHQDILRATSEVGAVRRLVRRSRGGV